MSDVLGGGDSDLELRVPNPLVEDKAWFVPITAVDNPVYIGESACSSFATGIRRVLDKDCTRAAHPPRYHYVSKRGIPFFRFSKEISIPNRATCFFKTYDIPSRRSPDPVLMSPVCLGGMMQV